MACCGQKKGLRQTTKPTPKPRTRPCTCDQADCRLCHLYHHDSRYRKLWGGAPFIRLRMNANGIGDALMGLIAVAGAKAQHPDKTIQYAAKHHSWLSLFNGYDDLLPEDAPGSTSINDEYIQECADKGQEPRHLRYCRAAGGVAPVLPTLKDKDKLMDMGRIFKGKICLGIRSVYNNRNYSILAWQTVEDLLMQAGYKTVILHDNLADSQKFQGDKLVAQSPEVVASAILNAACTVAIDSSMAHLSAIMGKPTIVLTGPTTSEAVFGYAPSVVGLPGVLACNGCFWQKPYNVVCDQAGCASLQSIDPRRVLAAVDKIVLPELVGRWRTLLDSTKLAVLRDMALKTNHLEGDVAELGVYRGGSAKLLGHYAPHGHLHLFDTFEGIPETDSHGEHQAGDFADTSLASVQAYLDNLNAVYHVGKFPETAVDDLRFRLVHVDLDTYQSTKAAIEYLVPRMVAGGMMVLDDFGWENCAGVASAVKEAGLKFAKVSEYQAVIRF